MKSDLRLGFGWRVLAVAWVLGLGVVTVRAEDTAAIAAMRGLAEKGVRRHSLIWAGVI